MRIICSYPSKTIVSEFWIIIQKFVAITFVRTRSKFKTKRKKIIHNISSKLRVLDETDAR